MKLQGNQKQRRERSEKVFCGKTSESKRFVKKVTVFEKGRKNA